MRHDEWDAGDWGPAGPPRAETTVYVPPGWPGSVRPPGAPDWERSATEFLLDCCPADYRLYPVLRRHPVVLARFAAECVEGQLRSSRSGLAEIRASLSGYVDPPVIEAATEAWQAQTARLTRTRRGVGLVEQALRGRVFVRRL